MNKDRYKKLMNYEAELTQEEIADSWHFCYEWDGLLIHKSWDEYEWCICFEEKQFDKSVKM